MTKTVEFCFDVISPAAYIAWHMLPKIAAAAGAEIKYTPFFLGGVMQGAGNNPPGTVANKGKWMASDLPRWAKMYGIEYRRNEVFPQLTLTAMRGAVAYQDTEHFHPYCDCLFRALHAENRDIQSPEVMIELLSPLGIDPAGFMTMTGDQTVKDTLKANTDGAVARGAFGAPTFFIGNSMHFGQDRLFMVAEDLGTSIHGALKD